MLLSVPVLLTPVLHLRRATLQVPPTPCALPDPLPPSGASACSSSDVSGCATYQIPPTFRSSTGTGRHPVNPPRPSTLEPPLSRPGATRPARDPDRSSHRRRSYRSALPPTGTRVSPERLVIVSSPPPCPREPPPPFGLEDLPPASRSRRHLRVLSDSACAFAEGSGIAPCQDRGSRHRQRRLCRPAPSPSLELPRRRLFGPPPTDARVNTYVGYRPRHGPASSRRRGRLRGPPPTAAARRSGDHDGSQ